MDISKRSTVCQTCEARRPWKLHAATKDPGKAAYSALIRRCQTKGECRTATYEGGRQVRMGAQQQGLFLRRDSALGRILVSAALADALMPAADEPAYLRFRSGPNGESLLERCAKGDEGARRLTAATRTSNWTTSYRKVWQLLEPKRRYYMHEIAPGVFQLTRIVLDGEQLPGAA